MCPNLSRHIAQSNTTNLFTPFGRANLVFVAFDLPSIQHSSLLKLEFTACWYLY